MPKKSLQMLQVWNDCKIELTLDFPGEVDLGVFAYSVEALANNLRMQAALIGSDGPHEFQDVEDRSDNED